MTSIAKKPKVATTALARPSRKGSGIAATWLAWISSGSAATSQARGNDFKDLAIRCFDAAGSAEDVVAAALALVSKGPSEARVTVNRWVLSMRSGQRPRGRRGSAVALVGKPCTPETIARRLSNAHSWIRACAEAGHIDWDVVFSRPKVNPYGKAQSASDEADEAAFAMDDVRVRLPLEMLATLALRRESLCGLRCRDVTSRKIRVRLKGGAEVDKVIPAELVETMVDYEAAVNPRKDGPDSPYLRSFRGAGLTPSGLSYLCKKNDLGSPHKVRHSAADKAKAEGASPWEIQDLLDHQSVSTTQIYLTARGKVDGKTVSKLAKAWRRKS